MVPVLSEWAEAVLSLKCAQVLLDRSGDDDAEVDRAASLHHEALVKLLTIPAPDGPALKRKLELYKDHGAYSFRETPQIVDVLNEDTVRLLARGLE